MKKILFPAVFSLIMFPLSMMAKTAYASFNPSNLMDDAVFDNASSMTPSQIDAFMNSFPNSCLSINHGFSAPDPTGYSPSTGFIYGGAASAGQVIYDAGQAYGLNPKVLITTLQKEEGLVRGDGPYGCSALAISASVGYGCPDSGSLYSYSNLNPPLYYQNGTPVTSVNNTCVNGAAKAGFSQQVIRAAWLLKFGEQRSEGNVNWAVIRGSWNNSDDPQTCYGGPMTQGYRKRCASDQTAVYYDGYTVIDGSSTHIDSGPTAGLYWYTPHFHGNQNFFDIYTTTFNFGSPYASCTYPTDSSGAVYRLFNPNTNGALLSSDPSEVCTATGYMGYIFDAPLVFPSGSGNEAIYRLQKNGNYLYTISGAERDQAVANYGYTLEGVAFTASSTQTANAPIAVYRLFYPPTGQYFYTVSSAELNDLVNNMGYRSEGIVFFSQNSVGNTFPNDIYRLANPAAGYLNTSSSAEKDSALLLYGFRDEGVGFQTRIGFTIDNLPIYRLAGNHGYLLTGGLGERKTALRMGYRTEGVAFFAYPQNNFGATKAVYRLVNSSGTYLYTSSSAETNTAIQQYGYRLEGVGFRVP